MDHLMLENALKRFQPALAINSTDRHAAVLLAKAIEQHGGSDRYLKITSSFDVLKHVVLPPALVILGDTSSISFPERTAWVSPALDRVGMGVHQFYYSHSWMPRRIARTETGGVDTIEAGAHTG